MPIRAEQPGDIDAIRALTTEAFATAPHSSGTEAAIVDGLRAAGALTLSLVAVAGDGPDEALLGHVAFSPVTIDGADRGWLGLGPVSVRPGRQRGGIGSALIREGLRRRRLRPARRPRLLRPLRLRGRSGAGAGGRAAGILHAPRLRRGRAGRHGALSRGFRCGLIFEPERRRNHRPSWSPLWRPSTSCNGSRRRIVSPKRLARSCPREHVDARDKPEHDGEC